MLRQREFFEIPHIVLQLQKKKWWKVQNKKTNLDLNSSFQWIKKTKMITMYVTTSNTKNIWPAVLEIGFSPKNWTCPNFCQDLNDKF